MEPVVDTCEVTKRGNECKGCKSEPIRVYVRGILKTLSGGGNTRGRVRGCGRESQLSQPVGRISIQDWVRVVGGTEKWKLWAVDGVQFPNIT